MNGESYETRLQPVADLICSWVESGDIKGAGVAVAVGGKPVWESYAGYARPSVESSSDILWPLASISKLYVAALIMALVERGELTLGTTVESVIPEFTGGGKELIQLRHLLTHTSGMIYESPVHSTRLEAQTPYDDMVDECYLYPLMFAPGEKLSYSDYGIALAGRVAERVTGMTFVDLIDALVIEPAGLTATTFKPTSDQRQVTAHIDGTYADGTKGAMYNSEYGLNLAHPAFGTVASLPDLLRFGLCFAPNGPRMLSEASIRAMTIDQTGGNAPPAAGGFGNRTGPAPWGIGFMISRPGSPSGPALLPTGSFGHGGASGCTLWIDPVDDIVVAYVSNKHALTGRPPFTKRLVSVVNMTIAELTRNS